MEVQEETLQRSELNKSREQKNKILRLQAFGIIATKKTFELYKIE